MFAVTSIYAAILGLIYVALSFHVANTRRTSQVSLGDGGDQLLYRRARAHGNFSEYVPIGLILIALSEAQGAPAIAVHALGLCLLVGRLLHGWAFIGPQMNAALRIAGMMLTLLALTFAALGLLFHTLV